MNELSPPLQIGHYAIIEAIGRGGMGVVYLARDNRLDRQVAIKCLRSDLLEPHYRDRFKREALLLAKLNHSHIVQIYDFIESQEHLALVMEYVDGKNLQAHLREHIVPMSQRLNWLAQIAHGLAVAHDAGIIHRDLKFENILINKHNIAKISDLGIAKFQDASSTLTEHVTGSYCAMSPEQARGEAIDFRSDLFSLGILAYQLLCGAHPFGDITNKLQLMQRIILQPPTSPLKYNPDLPPEAVALLGQLLSKNPQDRPTNTRKVAAQCEKLKQYFQDADTENDDTLALPQGIRQDLKSAARDNKTLMTGEHPTFDTRFESKPLTATKKLYRKTLGNVYFIVALTLLAIAGAYYLTPSQPRYIAILPPTLSSATMPESHQELVKEAAYDALQQSALQLKGYYVIPRAQISDINASNTSEGLEIVRRATAADELITTNMQCKADACTITLSRLTPDDKNQDSRLRLRDTKSVDVLTDNYLSVAAIVQANLGKLYSANVSNQLNKIDEGDYKKFLAINHRYRERGATKTLLDELGSLRIDTKKLGAVQTLYSEMALDVHYETNDPTVLANLEALLELNPERRRDLTYFYNLFYLQIAQKKYEDADSTIATIKQFNSSDSAINELHGYAMMAKKNHEAAIQFYLKALRAKNSASIKQYLAVAYWHLNKNNLAKQHLEELLKISPNLYKSQNLLGVISLMDGDLKSAIPAFEKLIEMRGDDLLSLNHLGMCYLLDKQYQKAIELFSRANELAPLKTGYLLNRADANDLAGNAVAADTFYKEIVQRLAGQAVNSESLMHLSQATAHLGDYTAALNYLQQLEKVGSPSYEVTYTAALVHTLANNKASAILNIEAALNEGMTTKWFGFSWFDKLCEEKDFRRLIEKFGEPTRCALQNIGHAPAS